MLREESNAKNESNSKSNDKSKQDGNTAKETASTLETAVATKEDKIEVKFIYLFFQLKFFNFFKILRNLSVY